MEQIPSTESKIEREFYLPPSRLETKVDYREKYHDNPAFISINWKLHVDSIGAGELRIVFFNPRTMEKLMDERLGESLSGEETFLVDELGFDPEKTEWGYSVYYKSLPEGNA